MTSRETLTALAERIEFVASQLVPKQPESGELYAVATSLRSLAAPGEQYDERDMRRARMQWIREKGQNTMEPMPNALELDAFAKGYFACSAPTPQVAAETVIVDSPDVVCKTAIAHLAAAAETLQLARNYAKQKPLNVKPENGGHAHNADWNAAITLGQELLRITAATESPQQMLDSASVERSLSSSAADQSAAGNPATEPMLEIARSLEMAAEYPHAELMQNGADALRAAALRVRELEAERDALLRTNGEITLEFARQLDEALQRKEGQ